MWKWILVLAFLILAAPVAARTGAKNSQPTPMSASERLDEILLKDGSILTGHILAEDSTEVVIEVEGIGRLEVPRDRIKDILRAGSRLGVRVDPDRNSILLTPTTETLPKGSHYFRSFELLFLNYGVGVTDNFNLSVASFFPVSTSWNFLILGAKWQVLDREDELLGLAATGSYFITPDDQPISTIGMVLGIGDARRSLNLAIDYGVDSDGNSGERIMLGGDWQFTRKMKAIVEWGNSSLLVRGGDDDFNGFITFGFRIFGEDMAFTMGAFRPLTADDMDSFIGLPMIMFSAHW